MATNGDDAKVGVKSATYNGNTNTQVVKNGSQTGKMEGRVKLRKFLVQLKRCEICDGEKPKGQSAK